LCWKLSPEIAVASAAASQAGEVRTIDPARQEASSSGL
jgi:hypothetical protein